MLTQLSNLIQSGIYCFKNESDKKIYLGHSSNILNAIQKHLTQIKYGVHHLRDLQSDIDKCQFSIIETIEDTTVRLTRLAYYCDQYRSEGYTLFNKYKGLKYTVRSGIEFINIETNLPKHYLSVSLINRNHDKIIVGLFNNDTELNEFIWMYYNEEYPIPVYCNNKLTKLYYKKKH